MYKIVDTYDKIEIIGNNSIVSPVLSMEDEHGGKAHIIKDDHCYILVVLSSDKIRYGFTTWIFAEAHEALKTLPNPND